MRPETSINFGNQAEKRKGELKLASVAALGAQRELQAKLEESRSVFGGVQAGVRRGKDSRRRKKDLCRQPDGGELVWKN